MAVPSYAVQEMSLSCTVLEEPGRQRDTGRTTYCREDDGQVVPPEGMYDPYSRYDTENCDNDDKGVEAGEDANNGRAPMAFVLRIQWRILHAFRLWLCFR